ncbi:hypothetical protein [Saccharospirillum impatiens]|uniref:hypothetical protein n=1 Tax=Saccharospirillum impatiens TaxID=169438 RepID=UPI00048AEC7B|nr:hypothetical protein [Saccharospirillum impatiens]
MQTTLAIAACLAVITGIVHSVLGELLIFRPMRRGTLVITSNTGQLKQRSVGILWATWHIASVFGWAFAVVLGQRALDPGAAMVTLVLGAAVLAYSASALLVLIGTRGRHPGWVALTMVAALTWVAAGGAVA